MSWGHWGVKEIFYDLGWKMPGNISSLLLLCLVQCHLLFTWRGSCELPLLINLSLTPFFSDSLNTQETTFPSSEGNAMVCIFQGSVISLCLAKLLLHACDD